MKILIVNSAEKGIADFTYPICRILNKLETVVFDYADCPSLNMNEYSGVIISGSPQGDDIVVHHQPYFQWINEFEKPVLGICAGHHIMGYIFGAKYLRNLEPESGDVEIEILIDDPIFYRIPERFLVRQMHNDSITLPRGFIHLAKSSACSNQAMRHDSKPLYSFQFHPEYLNHDLLFNFSKLCSQRDQSSE